MSVISYQMHQVQHVEMLSRCQQRKHTQNVIVWHTCDSGRVGQHLSNHSDLGVGMTGCSYSRKRF